MLQSEVKDECNWMSDAEINYWHLQTGSVIAYQKIGLESDQAQPVVFLHGGPGASELPIDPEGALWLRSLTYSGLEFYLYDQVGSGFSSRLNSPYEYTVNRHVEDLEQIRILTGNKKVILIGDSWGAILIARYLVRYSENVLKVVITSPGPMNPHEWWEEMTPRLEEQDYEFIRAKEGEKGLQKFIRFAKLLGTDIQAAYNFMGDSSMDNMYNEILTQHVAYNVVHDKSKKPEFTGMGWWASKMTLYDMTKKSNISVKPFLKDLKIPVFILRGEYDYLPEAMALEYKEIFSNSKYIQIPEAGHMLWKEKPEFIAAMISEFII